MESPFRKCLYAFESMASLDSNEKKSKSSFSSTSSTSQVKAIFYRADKAQTWSLASIWFDLSFNFGWYKNFPSRVTFDEKRNVMNAGAKLFIFIWS